MLIYSQEIITKIRTAVEGLSDQDQKKFSDQFILLNELEALIQQQSTLKEEEEAEQIDSSENDPNINQEIDKIEKSIKEKEKQIDEKIALPLYGLLPPEPESQQTVARPSESATIPLLYFFRLLGLIPFIGIFFRNLVKSQEKNMQPKPLPKKSMTPAKPTLEDQKLKDFLSLRSKSLYQKQLKESIVTALENSIELPEGQQKTMINRIKSLKYTHALDMVSMIYHVKDKQLQTVVGMSIVNNTVQEKLKNLNSIDNKELESLTRCVENAEKFQRGYIVGQVLEKHDIQQQLSDIGDYEETLDHLISGYDINEPDDVEFKGPDEANFLRSVIEEHTKRKRQLALNMTKYYQQCEQEFFTSIPNLKTALAFADVSAQKKFVDIMKRTSDKDLKKQLKDFVVNYFNPNFLKTSEQALIEFDKTPGFRDAFDQASLKDKLQLIRDYELPNSIEKQCDDFFDSKKYKSLSEDQLPRIKACFDKLKKKHQLNSNKISQDFKEILPRLSLDELKDLQQLLAPQKLGNNDENDDFYKNNLDLIKKYFIDDNRVYIHSVMRTQSMLSFLQKQNDLINQPDKLVEPQKPLSQEIAEQFIEDQEILSKSIEPINFTAASSSTARTIELQKLQKNATYSTQQRFKPPELGGEIDPPRPKSGPSQ